MANQVDVVEVTPEQLAEFGGADWDTLVAEAKREESPLVFRTVKDSDPLDANRAWLRKHQGRAFLLRQNW
jgi:hypothetical protein